MTYGYIYKIVFPNGKHYIGLTTTSLKQRTKEHKYCAKNGNTKYMYNALRKYDIVDTFELIEIDRANTEEELCEKEIRYIILYNSYYMNKNGYNMTYGGDGTFGYVHTEENNQKNRERMKKYYENNPESREKMSKIIKQHYENNPEAREQMSKIKKQYYENNPEAKEKMSKITKEHYKKNSEAGKEHSERIKTYYENNPEAIQQMSKIKKQHYENNPEAGKEHSERMKKYFKNNPEAGKEHSERIKIYFNNPETRLKHSEIRKKYFENNPEARQKLLDIKGKNKPFDVFTKDGTFIKTFTYQFEAKEYLQTEYNITSTFKISEVLAGSRNNSAGFVFKYK
jgi:hypothetical protein